MHTKRLLLTLLLIVTCMFIVAQVQTGKASYYSKRTTGARTASGMRMHHDSLVCAHKTYPFGTLLKVRNLNNDKSVIVKVVDRGPFVRGRVIDLSYAAAHQLGMIASGIASVEVSQVVDVVVPFQPEPVPVPELDLGVAEEYIPVDAFGDDKKKKH